MRTKFLLLVAGGLAVAALVIWQRSPDPGISIPPAVADVKAPAPEAIGSDAATVAVAKDAPTPPPGKDTASAANRKPAPTRVSRRDPPAAAAGEGTKTAAPPPSTPSTATKVPSARLTYERRVTDATRVADEDSEQALLALQQLTADEPSRPEAYEAMAGIRLRQREYGQARELLGSALRNGGKATFALIHDHSRGNFEKKPDATCVGELTVLASEVRFDAPESGDRFAASWDHVRDTGSNKFFGSGIGGFHVTITAEGKMKNFNLAPKSRDKAEGKLILDLLNGLRAPANR